MDEDQSAKTESSSPPAHVSGTHKGEERIKEEGKEAGRKETGAHGGANRPSGTSTGRDASAATPKDPIDPNSPNLPPA